MDLVLATHNAGKVAEFQTLLAPLGYRLRTAGSEGVPDVAETGTTFVENALIKAHHTARHTGLPALADDSGLIVDALNGAPGVYSARFAGADANAEMNNRKLLEALSDVPDEERTARFCCVLVYLHHPHDPLPLIAQATWEGSIAKTWEEGINGFGYDPIFEVPTHQKTAAQLSPTVKNHESHRGQAMQQLLSLLKTR